LILKNIFSMHKNGAIDHCSARRRQNPPMTIKKIRKKSGMNLTSEDHPTDNNGLKVLHIFCG